MPTIAASHSSGVVVPVRCSAGAFPVRRLLVIVDS